MQHARLVKALTKVGATISNPNTNRPNYFVATKGEKRIVWYSQAQWDDASVLNAVCVCEPHPDTDAMTDLFLDYFPRTIRAAVLVVA
jgi:hypothetical protein